MTRQEKKDLVRATLLAWEGAWRLETVGYQYLDEDDHAYQEAQELVDRIYSEATEDRFNCGDYSLFIRRDTDDLADLERPDK